MSEDEEGWEIDNQNNEDNNEYEDPQNGEDENVQNDEGENYQENDIDNNNEGEEDIDNNVQEENPVEEENNVEEGNNEGGEEYNGEEENVEQQPEENNEDAEANVEDNNNEVQDTGEQQYDEQNNEEVQDNYEQNDQENYDENNDNEQPNILSNIKLKGVPEKHAKEESYADDTLANMRKNLRQVNVNTYDNAGAGNTGESLVNIRNKMKKIGEIPMKEVQKPAKPPVKKVEKPKVQNKPNQNSGAANFPKLKPVNSKDAGNIKKETGNNPFNVNLHKIGQYSNMNQVVLKKLPKNTDSQTSNKLPQKGPMNKNVKPNAPPKIPLKKIEKPSGGEQKPNFPTLKKLPSNIKNEFQGINNNPLKKPIPNNKPSNKPNQMAPKSNVNNNKPSNVNKPKPPNTSQNKPIGNSSIANKINVFNSSNTNKPNHNKPTSSNIQSNKPKVSSGTSNQSTSNKLSEASKIFGVKLSKVSTK